MKRCAAISKESKQIFESGIDPYAKEQKKHDSDLLHQLNPEISPLQKITVTDNEVRVTDRERGKAHNRKMRRLLGDDSRHSNKSDEWAYVMPFDGKANIPKVEVEHGVPNKLKDHNGELTVTHINCIFIQFGSIRIKLVDVIPKSRVKDLFKAARTHYQNAQGQHKNFLIIDKPSSEYFVCKGYMDFLQSFFIECEYNNRNTTITHSDIKKPIAIKDRIKFNQLRECKNRIGLSLRLRRIQQDISDANKQIEDLKARLEGIDSMLLLLNQILHKQYHASDYCKVDWLTKIRSLEAEKYDIKNTLRDVVSQ